MYYRNNVRMNRQQNMQRRNNQNNQRMQNNNVELGSTLKKLWVENAIWNRIFIISSMSNSQDLQYVIKRLIRNPEDISKELKRYYGEERADRLKELLADLVMINVKMVGDIKSGNTRMILETRNKLGTSCDTFSEFMSKLEPGMDKEEMYNLLLDYFKGLESQVTDRLKGDYASEIIKFDENQAKAEKIAEYMNHTITAHKVAKR